MLMQICEKDSSFVSKYKNPVAWKNIFRSSSFKIKSNMKIPIKALEVYEVNFEGKQK